MENYLRPILVGAIVVSALIVFGATVFGRRSSDKRLAKLCAGITLLCLTSVVAMEV